MMGNRFFRFYFGPILTLAFLLLNYSLDRYMPPGSTTVAFSFVVLTLAGIVGGFRASLVSAALVSLYVFLFAGYNIYREVIVILSLFMVSGTIGWGKHRLIETTKEAALNRRKAEMVDSLNGNVKRMLRSLSILDDLRRHKDAYTPQKKEEMIEQAHDGLADLITSVEGWKEMAENRRMVIEEMERAGHYPWRAEDVVMDTHILVREVLMKVNRMVEREEYD